MTSEEETDQFPNYICTIVNGFTGGPVYRYLLSYRYLEKLHDMFNGATHNRYPVCGATIHDDACIYAIYHCECGTRMAVIRSAWNGRCNVAWFDVPVIGVDEGDII